MAEIAQTDGESSLEAPPLRLGLYWQDDRWVQRLAVGETPLAVSVEWDAGAADTARVVSPVYQQLSTDTRPDGGRFLVVGQWGRHHFSGVLDLSGEPGGPVTVEVDAAVRTRAPLEVLAATYHVLLPPGVLAAADPGGVEWTLPPPTGGRLRLEALACGDAAARLDVGEARRAATRVQVIAPLSAEGSTHRILYRWRWLPGPAETDGHSRPNRPLSR